MRFFLALCIIIIQIPSFAAANTGAHNPKPFGLWLEEVRQEARKKGISSKTLDVALEAVEPIDRVIELDRKQPESTLTFQEYLAKIISDMRVSTGEELYQDRQHILKEVSERYGVQSKYIIALWGIETNYGSNMGSFNVVQSLATLAYDGRRSDYFREELMKSLKIIDDGHIEAYDMVGSWAGAMGQCQFMPSSFLNFAEDYDGDGKRDIWSNESDIFASIANYLSSSGWDGSEEWGYPVTLPTGFNKSLADISSEKTIEQWSALGVKPKESTSSDDLKKSASVIFVGEGEDAEPYMVFNNYKVLLKWNRSRYFATAVGILADQIE